MTTFATGEAHTTQADHIADLESVSMALHGYWVASIKTRVLQRF